MRSHLIKPPGTHSKHWPSFLPFSSCVYSDNNIHTKNGTVGIKSYYESSVKMTVRTQSVVRICFRMRSRYRSHFLPLLPQKYVYFCILNYSAMCIRGFLIVNGFLHIFLNIKSAYKINISRIIP